jgi:hypothetical protein
MLIFTTMLISEYLGVGLYMHGDVHIDAYAIIVNNHNRIMRLSLLNNRIFECG